MFLYHNTGNTVKYVSMPKIYKRRNGVEKKRKEVEKGGEKQEVSTS